MAELIRGLDAARIARNLEQVREEIGRDERRDPRRGEVRGARGAGARSPQAGITVVGENRAQELEAKHAAYGDAFTWDFIGQLQSRKVKTVLPLVRYVHSVCTDSALAQLEKHGTPETEILVEVNVAGEEGKAGVAPADLGDFIARSPAKVVGLMTMPPYAENARGQPPLVRRAGPAGRRPRAVRSCRWAPRRTSPSRPRKGPRSCA